MLVAAPQKSARSRGRPSLREAEVIDNEVLAAATQCFLANGFVATTMDAVAIRAGVSKATLYQRYDDKAALLRAVMHDRIMAWSAISDARVVNWGDTLEARLKHYARSLTRWRTDPEVRAIGELLRECWGSARHVAEEMQAIRTKRMKEVLERDIREFAAADGLNVADFALIAELFLGMIEALHRHMDLRYSTAAPADVERLLDNGVMIFLSGKAAWQSDAAG